MILNQLLLYRARHATTASPRFKNGTTGIPGTKRNFYLSLATKSDATPHGFCSPP